MPRVGELVSAFSRPGVYGFQLSGVSLDRALIDPVPTDWPLLVVDQRPESADDLPPIGIGDGRAVTRLLGGGYLRIERAEQRATIMRSPELTADALVHPFLAPIAAICAMWNGWLPFHAGGFVDGDGTWLVLGDRGSGKSTLMASLRSAGVAVVSDDLVIVNGARVYAGPRTLDLREDAAGRHEAARWIADAGGRDRWRLDLPAIEPELPPVAGAFFIDWSDDLGFESVATGDKVQRFADSLTVAHSIDVPQLMALATLPMWEMRRPHAWERLEEGTAAMLDLVRR